jgi:RNA polymerase sigma-70 factor (ECF subfamily)
MYRVAIKMIGNNDAVGDIVQEVFVSLYEKYGRSNYINHYSSWLYKATYYKCIDYIKQQSKFSKLEILMNKPNEEEPFDKQEAKAMIRKALNTLESKVRFLVVLYSEGLSYKEIAEATDIPFNSVGKTLSRALKKLEKELKMEYYELF